MQQRQQTSPLHSLLIELKSNGTDLNTVINSTNLQKIKAVNPTIAAAAEKNGYTYLHAAALAYEDLAVRYLVGLGVNVNAVDNQQRKVLQIDLELMRQDENVWRHARDTQKYAVQNRAHTEMVIRTPTQYGFRFYWANKMLPSRKNIWAVLLEKGALISDNNNLTKEEMEFFLIIPNFISNIDVITCRKKLAVKTHTALHTAAINNRLPAIESVPEGCAEINQKDIVLYTPLHYALEKNRPKSEAVKLLISKKADVNAVTEFGETPLHIAIRNMSLECVEDLFASGRVTTVNAKNFDQKTAIELMIDAIKAKSYNITQEWINICNQLISNGARVDVAMGIELSKAKVPVDNAKDNNTQYLREKAVSTDKSIIAMAQDHKELRLEIEGYHEDNNNQLRRLDGLHARQEELNLLHNTAIHESNDNLMVYIRQLESRNEHQEEVNKRQEEVNRLQTAALNEQQELLRIMSRQLHEMGRLIEGNRAPTLPQIEPAPTQTLGLFSLQQQRGDLATVNRDQLRRAESDVSNVTAAARMLGLD